MEIRQFNTFKSPLIFAPAKIPVARIIGIVYEFAEYRSKQTTNGYMLILTGRKKDRKD
jgi:hypothetical protein